MMWIGILDGKTAIFEWDLMRFVMGVYGNSMGNYDEIK